VLTKDEKDQLDCTDFDDALGVGLYHYNPTMMLGGYTSNGANNSSREGDGKGILHRGLVVNRQDEVLYEFLPMHHEIVAGGGDLGVYRAIEEEEGGLGAFDVFRAVEGSLLRLFYYGGKWLLTTNRKMDAFQSRWSSKYSFGDMMVYTLKCLFPSQAATEVYPFFLNSLDKTKRYVFMIRFNNDNRIVCTVHDLPIKHRMILLGYYEDDGQVILAYDKLLDHPVLGKLGRQPPLETQETPTSVAELDKFVMEHIQPMNNPGVILFHRTKNVQYKILHPRYVYLAGLRGNQSNLALRYLELRAQRDHDPTHEDILEFTKLYERNGKTFQMIENGLMEVAKRINYWYTERYVNNRFISVPYPEYSIMKKCHQWYLQDVSNRRVYLRVVMDFLKRESPLFLYRFLHRLRDENRR